MELAEAQHDNPEGRKFDSRWSHWDFSLIQSFRPHYVHGLTEMSIGNISWGEGGKRGPVRRADNPTTFICPLSGNTGTSTSWKLKCLWGLYRDCFTRVKYLEVNNFLLEDLPNGYKQESETWTTEGHWPYRVAAPHKQTNADSW
jgi:hypothetical protein